MFPRNFENSFGVIEWILLGCLILELKLESVSYWSKVSVVPVGVNPFDRAVFGFWYSGCFEVDRTTWNNLLTFLLLFIISETGNFQNSKWSVKLALFPSIFKNNKTRRNSRTEQFKEIHATFQTMTKLESICQYVVTVKSTMKILSIFVAFSENVNFTGLTIYSFVFTHYLRG